jgi:hypothetical protein
LVGAEVSIGVLCCIANCCDWKTWSLGCCCQIVEGFSTRANCPACCGGCHPVL